MKKIILPAFIILFTIEMLAAQSNIGGLILNDTILTTANSPYHVVSDILIPVGIKVTLEPGVHFQFDDAKRIVVDGFLQANGTPADSIFFEAFNPSAIGGTWWGISFSSTTIAYDSIAGGGSIVNYCSFKNGGGEDGSHLHHAVVVDGANNMRVENSTFSDYGMAINLSGGGNSVLNCIFKNHFTAHYAYSGISIYNSWLSSPDTVRNCAFYNHQDNALDIFSPAIIENNCFLHCSLDANIYCCNAVIPVIEMYSYYGVTIENNYIASACNSAIALMVTCDSSVVIAHNTFINNYVNIVMSQCYRTPKIIENNFLSCYTHHLYCSTNLIPLFGCQAVPGSYYTMDLSSNYFGGMTSPQLAAALYDLYDDINTKVIFTHTTTAADTFFVGSLNSCNYVPTANCYDSVLIAVMPAVSPDGLTVFPNPSRGDFTFRYDSKSIDKTGITIYDMLGRTIQHYPFLKTNADFRFGNELKQGIYMLVIVVDGVRIMKKIVKE